MIIQQFKVVLESHTRPMQAKDLSLEVWKGCEGNPKGVAAVIRISRGIHLGLPHFLHLISWNKIDIRATALLFIRIIMGKQARDEMRNALNFHQLLSIPSLGVSARKKLESFA
jgi:hypothetical protein